MAPKKEQTTPVSNDPRVPTAETTDPATAVQADGTVDAQAAAIAGAAKRQAKEAEKQTDTSAGVVPTGGIVRQLEDGAETDRRTGANADKSLAGENLPVLRPNEPDPRQGVTTGDLTNPGIVEGQDTQAVTFLRGYHLYNAGETATFSADEAQRLIDLGAAE
ncbi:hypothetical protein [Deinococcus humi]|uniref:Uncharacterized protein n=1 Tax=Deinococcus humi TaxID=662880 RepID=A0A7W8NEU7_9DEIO|nr:hypothetical protein [Deinococcus humi]MBB5361337.1 hypothetical protein [Deinococcus humi]GGO19533.1 hypothetical protein GCM10008949_04010 [Deinococcus humi]